MTVIKIRLCNGDVAEYGAPEELTLDVESVKDMRASEQAAIDQEIGMALSMFVNLMEDGVVSVAHVGRVAGWLALRNAGINLPWNDFDPRLGRATITVERDEQRPPAGGPSQPSSEDSAPPTSSKPSNRSSASKRTSTP